MAIAASIADRPAVVVATTNPFVLPAALVAARHLHRRPVVVLAYDIYPDVLEACGVLKAGSLMSRFGSACTRYWMTRATGVVFIGHHMAESAITRHGRPKAWRVIPVGEDVARFEPELLAKSALEPSLARWCQERVVIGYVGNMGNMHDWRTLAEAAPLLLNRVPTSNPFGILVAATGPGADSLRKHWRALDDSRVRFLPPLDDDTWARVQAACNIALVSLRSDSGNSSLPSKAVSAMASGSALVTVAPTESELACWLTEHGCGVNVEPGDANALAHALGHLVDNDVERESLGNAALAAARTTFDIDVVARQWIDFLSELGVSLSGSPARHERGVEQSG